MSATWLDDFLTAIKRLRRNGALLDPRNYLNIGAGLDIQPGPGPDDYTLTATGTPAWPGTASDLLAGDGSIVAVGSGLSLSGGTLAATGGGGGGATTFEATAGEEIHAGRAVYVSGYSAGRPVVRRALATNSERMPAVGIVASVVGSICTVQTTGTLEMFSGLTPGQTYYVDELGQPVNIGEIMTYIGTRYAQPIGYAISPTTLSLLPGSEMIVLTE